MCKSGVATSLRGDPTARSLLCWCERRQYLRQSVMVPFSGALARLRKGAGVQLGVYRTTLVVGKALTDRDKMHPIVPSGWTGRPRARLKAGKLAGTMVARRR